MNLRLKPGPGHPETKIKDHGRKITMTVTITAGLAPQEAARLLIILERGYQAAREVSMADTCLRPLFTMAQELNGLSVDTLWETFYATGIRQPGEDTAQFARRTGAGTPPVSRCC